ncbi:hypothetical protein GN958_ATG02432 [Phytophthora infestans]|uniref:Uncharacterized protein n=2 Tax=Phytophthora infestans TaxID=4787 RepID=A0A8S9VCS6_PHYIN|nr:hypothetical protein GN958_ATG14091 [Phytophthora infestans]KAF4148398.1 hypothetical protein GN958_ATG02432 [Phytophthora infestans]KAI9984928.1 hypothetical protein PInf_004231 [Phytophthora infestans]
MPSIRTIAQHVFTGSALYTNGQGLEGATSTSSSCSSMELHLVQTQVTAIRAALESDADSSNKALNIPSACTAALTFDLSAAIKGDEEACSIDCLAWVGDVVEVPPCRDEEMLMYQRRMTAFLKRCNEFRHVRLQENDSFEYSNRLRGLASGHPEGRSLSVKGLVDALLVVTLNNAL